MAFSSSELDSPRSWRGMTMHGDLLGSLRLNAPGHVPPIRTRDGFECMVHKSLANRAVDELHEVPLPPAWSSPRTVSTRTELLQRRATELRTREDSTFHLPSFSPRHYNQHMKDSGQFQACIASPRVPPAVYTEGAPVYTRSMLLQKRRHESVASELLAQQTFLDTYGPRSF